jgi:hypothetical protein
MTQTTTAHRRYRVTFDNTISLQTARRERRTALNNAAEILRVAGAKLDEALAQSDADLNWGHTGDANRVYADAIALGSLIGEIYGR